MGKHIIIQRKISAEERDRRQAALVWRLIVATVVMSWVVAFWVIAAWSK